MSKKMEKYVCPICDYIYEFANKYLESEVVKGKPFDKLPEKWSCPQCGTLKKDFKKV